MQILVFVERGKQERKTAGKTSLNRVEKKLNARMTAALGIEPGIHWWKVSALTTTPTLLPSE